MVVRNMKIYSDLVRRKDPDVHFRLHLLRLNKNISMVKSACQGRDSC